MRDEWNVMRSGDYTDSSTANATDIFFPRMCGSTHKKHNKREPSLFMGEVRCTEMLCLCSKTYCCYDRNSKKYKFSSKGLNNRTLQDCGDGPMSKDRKVMDDSVNVISTNRGLRTAQHVGATYDQINRKCLAFPPTILEDGLIHTTCVILWKVALLFCVLFSYLYFLFNILVQSHHMERTRNSNCRRFK